MSGFDGFISKSFADVIKKNLGLRTYEKIEKITQMRYGVTIGEAISDFGKIRTVLKELFPNGTDGIIQDWVDVLMSYDKHDASILLKDQTLSGLILESFGNICKKIILQNSYHSDIIPNIIKRSKIPRATGYRLVNELIKDGLLVKDGNIIARDGKILPEYMSLFEDVNIHLHSNTIVTKIKLKKEHVANSEILKIMFC